MNNCISFPPNSAKLLRHFPKNREHNDDKNMVFDGINVLSEFACNHVQRLRWIFDYGRL